VKRDTLVDVQRAEGGGFQIRPFRAERGTFLIERVGGKHRRPALTGISRHAANHYVLTLPKLRDLRVSR
jgi:hypothetical protein